MLDLFSFLGGMFDNDKCIQILCVFFCIFESKAPFGLTENTIPNYFSFVCFITRKVIEKRKMEIEWG